MTDRANPTDVIQDELREKIAALLWNRLRDRLRGLRGRRIMPTWTNALPEERDLYRTDADAILALQAAQHRQPEAADEYMSVSITRDGIVTSHNAYDADFDEMVAATEKIVSELQKRLSDRKYCPYSHGGARKHDNAAQHRQEDVAGMREALEPFDPVKFGIKVLFHMDGLSCRKAAKSAGVSASTLNRITRGEMPDLPTYLRLKEWLHKRAEGRETNV